MTDIILIIVNTACLIGFIFIIIATEKNTKVRRQEIKILKDYFKKLEEPIRIDDYVER